MWNTSPKFGVGWWGVRRGRKKKDPAKKRLGKKIGNNVARRVRALRPSYLSLRPAL
jgi:hypothetical protein